jgi:hypothetical protein
MKPACVDPASARVSDDIKGAINTDVCDNATKRRYGQQQQLAATLISKFFGPKNLY